MGSLKYVSLAVALTALVTYRFYPALPPCFYDFPLSTRLAVRAVPITNAIATTLEKLGLINYWHFNRAMMDHFSPPDVITEAVSSVDTQFDGVDVRVYLPKQREPNGAALMYIHGGNWATSSINAYDKLVRGVAEQVNIVTVNVGYRLAPESPYPAAIDDVEKAFRHLVKHAAEYDIDPSRIAVAGDSAGGNLAAALSIRLRDSAAATESQVLEDPNRELESQAQPKLQILIYPALQLANFSTVSMLINKGDFLLPRSSAIHFVLLYALGMDYYNSTLRTLSEQYLKQGCYRLHYSDSEKVYIDIEEGDIRERILTDTDRKFLTAFKKDARGRDLFNPVCMITEQATLDELHYRLASIFNTDFSPLLSGSVEGLPPTYIVSCGCDVLRDDAFLFTERLRDAGVEVEHSHYADKCHGFYFLDIESGIWQIRSFLDKANFSEL